MSRCEHSSNQACDDCLRATAPERYATTPPEPKATEPSDDELRTMIPDVGTVPFGDAALRASWRAGFHSRDGEFADLAARSKEQIVTLSRLNEQLCEERTWTVAHLEHWKACAAARYDMFAEKAAEVEALKAELADWNAAVGATGDAPLDKLKLAIQHDVATKQELRDLKAERDKLHAALAWVMVNPNTVCWHHAAWVVLGIDGVTVDRENHDGTDAGRAAALVRLWERVTRAGAELSGNSG